MNAAPGGGAIAAHGVEAVQARAVAEFTRRFGGSPRWAAAAPGRVNLIGEHTDYNNGLVLPIAINRVCVAVGAEAPAGETVVYSADMHQTAAFDARRPMRAVDGQADLVACDAGETRISRGSWISYVAGVIEQFRAPGTAGVSLTGGTPVATAPDLINLRIVIASSVPLGGGLSSSAAVEVAIATLMEQVTGLALDPLDKARLCQRAEHTFAGVPCGLMDQTASIMGRRDHALLIDCRSHEVTPVPMPGPGELAIVIANTGVRHALASGEYAARRAACERAARKLSLPSLREAEALAPAAFARLDDEEQRCARHVVSENRRVAEAARALASGDLARMGRLMEESHRSLRDDYRVSCPELDTLVDVASASRGVYGARMTGGGFGGCIVALVKPDHVEALIARLKTEYRSRHGLDCVCFTTSASAGASRDLPHPPAAAPPSPRGPR